MPSDAAIELRRIMTDYPDPLAHQGGVVGFQLLQQILAELEGSDIPNTRDQHRRVAQMNLATAEEAAEESARRRDYLLSALVHATLATTAPAEQ